MSKVLREDRSSTVLSVATLVTGWEPYDPPSLLGKYEQPMRRRPFALRDERTSPSVTRERQRGDVSNGESAHESVKDRHWPTLLH